MLIQVLSLKGTYAKGDMALHTHQLSNLVPGLFFSRFHVCLCSGKLHVSFLIQALCLGCWLGN